MQIKILLVEDQKLMRIGIKSLFCEYPELEIIGEAVNGKEAVEKSRLIKPDIVLMDIGLPDISGIEATKQILEHNNNIKVIMLTSHISEEELNASLMFTYGRSQCLYNKRYQYGFFNECHQDG